MKVALVQPPYSMDPAQADACFAETERLAASCEADCDLIVFPEYMDIPADAQGEEFNDIRKKYNARSSRLAFETSRRCRAIVCANFSRRTESGWRNCTHIFDRTGRLVGIYEKAHPAPSEVKSIEEGGHGFDCSYTLEPQSPYILELDGLRLAFLTCYDFYMYEYFPRLAREKPDIIIGCSLQRTDSHSALEIFGRFLSYQTNAYLVRASVSLGEDSPVCGCSMVVSPKGEMLLNMENRVGVETVEFNFRQKHIKNAGHGGQPMAHWEYMEEGRRPWLYRNAGSNIIPTDRQLPYPRLCAHRGYNTTLPENTLPAYGAAVAMGAREIEFDLWSTKDRQLVSIHDSTLDRVSDGTGDVREYTLEELQQLDFGCRKGEEFKGLKIATFEDILRKFSGSVIMNIHVKIWDAEAEDPMYKEIHDLLKAYDAEKHCYMMSTSDRCLREFHARYPEIVRCVGWDGNPDPLSMVRRAVALGAEKVQLFKPYFNEDSVKEAHKNGILCNVFFADDPEEARKYLDMGIDCILTNDYLRIRAATGID